MEAMERIKAKKELRRQMLEKRNKMDTQEKQALDAQICTSLMDWVEGRRATVVHSYLPIGSEINVLPAIRHWLQNGVRVVCPKALPARKMVNLELHDLDQLETGYFKTRHPAHSVPYEGQYDLIIVPGLAFDRAGMRVGYGSGYYDAFLAGQDAHRLGICYSFQLVDRVPFSEQDTRLDAILSV